MLTSNNFFQALEPNITMSCPLVNINFTTKPAYCCVNFMQLGIDYLGEYLVFVWFNKKGCYWPFLSPKHARVLIPMTKVLYQYTLN